MNSCQQKVLDLYPDAQLYYENNKVFQRYVIRIPLLPSSIMCNREISDYGPDEQTAWRSAWENIQERMLDALGR